MNLGFNGSASSLNITLVEDTQSGDAFVNPDTPSLWAFSLPKGGIGRPVIYTTPIDLNPDGFAPTNVPFYFCGICTGWQKAQRDIGGKTISVTLADPREMFSGIQCLLGGFALSQNITGSLPRYSNVKNVIDVFGYYDYGMTSGKNEYGMTWSSIQQCLEAVRATVNNIGFEFYFTGTTFSDVPSYYRINEDIIDLNGLIQRVVSDAGSDFIVVARKTSSSVCVVEIRGIKRTNFNLLTQNELDSFVSARNDIIESYKKGKEYRNEPTSTIVVGGMRNSNYTAYPSTYDKTMHLILDSCGSGSVFKENYGSFPSDIKVRLFGGSGNIEIMTCDGNDINNISTNFDVDSGAIYPFWGFTPDDLAYPLIEPFLPLDHYLFDKDTSIYGQLKQRTPDCKISVQNYTVRVRQHQDIFLDGDGDSDSRPFAYLNSYQFGSGIVASGYMKGLPLNTEVLRAATISEDTFFNLYWLYYPDIAESLGFPKIDFSDTDAYVDACIASGYYIDLKNHCPSVKRQNSYDFTSSQFEYAIDSKGRIGKLAADDAIGGKVLISNILERYSAKLYDAVRNYAFDNMGKKFLVCLPKSQIMNRIWNNLPVPTNTSKPSIEYVVDDRGYWEYVPEELNGVVTGTSGTSVFTAGQENQIRRRFMLEDSRFLAMVGIDWKPSGNINFNSNGYNKALFQDLPVTEFRPNNIADGNPSYVLCSCSVNQIAKRPDLALLELPSVLRFEPVDNPDEQSFSYRNSGNDENLGKKLSIIKYFNYLLQKNEDFRIMLKKAANATGISFVTYVSSVFDDWSNELLYTTMYGTQQEMSTEYVMDLKGAIIPLTSTWVSYGPWFTASGNAEGMTRVEVDQALVPWNFTRPTSPTAWDANLNAAGEEKLARSLSDMYWLDSAVISVAGFPEYGPAQPLGYNSNLTAINVDFGVGGVKTTYNFSTYLKRPGTFRKGDFDNISKSRIDTREKLPDTNNINIVYNFDGSNRTNQFEN